MRFEVHNDPMFICVEEKSPLKFVPGGKRFEVHNEKISVEQLSCLILVFSFDFGAHIFCFLGQTIFPKCGFGKYVLFYGFPCSRDNLVSETTI